MYLRTYKNIIHSRCAYEIKHRKAFFYYHYLGHLSPIPYRIMRPIKWPATSNKLKFYKRFFYVTTHITTTVPIPFFVAVTPEMRATTTTTATMTTTSSADGYKHTPQNTGFICIFNVLRCLHLKGRWHHNPDRTNERSGSKCFPFHSYRWWWLAPKQSSFSHWWWWTPEKKKKLEL